MSVKLNSIFPSFSLVPAAPVFSEVRVRYDQSTGDLMNIMALAVMPTAFLAVTDSVHPELGGSLSMYQQVLLSQLMFKST